MNYNRLAILQSEDQPITITLESTQEQMVRLLQEKCLASIKEIGKSTHVRSIDRGFEIEFASGKIETIFAYFRTPKIKQFKGQLKFDINKGWTIRGAVLYLGEPIVKSSKMVEIIYPHLGLGLVFQGTWNNQNSIIDYAYLYEPQKTRFCAACKKEFSQSIDQSSNIYQVIEKIHICKCHLVSYCSSGCVKKHYRQHLIFCDIGQL